MLMWQPPIRWTLLSLLLGICSSRDCLVPSGRRSAKDSPAKVELTLESLVNDELELFWVNEEGSETYVRDIPAGGVTKETTHQGHLFRAYSKTAPRQLVMEHSVLNRAQRTEVFIIPCGDLGAFSKSARAKEFEQLAYRGDDSKCDGDDVGLWSCVRYVGKDDLALRDPDLYGLADGEAEGGQHAHGFADGTYTRQIKDIPKVTAHGPGYLRMRFTPKLMEALRWWQNYVAKHGAGVREFVAGGYTNAKSHELSIMSLDNHRDIHRLITAEMKDILEWWTGMPLVHTATYGVRTYHRGSVLIDHVDRHDTHVASAVLQLSQSVDAGYGWPLEVLCPQDVVGEVYLQPGELVLYEGAWLRHGRPMRWP